MKGFFVFKKSILVLIAVASYGSMNGMKKPNTKTLSIEHIEQSKNIEFCKNKINELNKLDITQNESDSNKIFQGRKVAVGGIFFGTVIYIASLFVEKEKDRNSLQQVAGSVGWGACFVGGCIGVSDRRKFDDRHFEKMLYAEILSNKNKKITPSTPTTE